MVFSTVIQVNHVSVYHDELWNYPASVAMLKGERLLPLQEIRIFKLPIPIVSGPYQGAVKSWISAPFIGLFGTSPAVLRGINLLLAFIYLSSLCWALSATVPRLAARSIFLLPLLDTNFLMYVPIDQGPFLLQSLFIAVAIGAFLRAVKYRERRWMVLVLLMMSATLSDKITSIPCVAVFGILFFLWLWPLPVRGISPIKTILLVLFSISPLLPNIIYFIRNGFDPLFQMTGIGSIQTAPYLERLLYNCDYFFFQFFNSPLLMSAFTEISIPSSAHSWFSIAGLVLMGLAPVVTALAGQWQASGWRMQLFLPVLFVLSLCAFSAVPGLNRPWHFLLLQPIFVMAVFEKSACFVTALSSKLNTRLKRGLLSSAVTAVMALLLLQGCIDSWRMLKITAEKEGINANSMALYDVMEFLRQRGAKKAVCLSYSLSNPLYVLMNGELQTVDCAFHAFSDLSSDMFIKYLEEPGTCLVSRHSMLGEISPPDYIEWLNIGSSWLRTQDLLKDPRLKTYKTNDARGTEFGVLYLESP
ncbi:MAG: hypothetical protein ABIK28_18925 [Planctomycetota bacterium]